MRHIIGYAGLIMTVMVVFMAVTGPAKADTEPDEALASYHKGIAAQTIGEREQYFERALELYLASYNRMKQEGKTNALLCYNIGNCYFNLEQNEDAIFYYQLGKKLLPGNAQIAANLAEALAKRENAVDIDSGGLLENVLFFHYRLSTAQQINTLVGAAILAALSLAWLIIRPNIKARYAAILSGFVVGCFAASLAVEYYMPIHMGIVMKISDVRRGAGSGFAPITNQPLGGGSSVEVISMAGGWYGVKLNDGRQGFIKQENVKIITI
jgi:hypothetical protein